MPVTDKDILKAIDAGIKAGRTQEQIAARLGIAYQTLKNRLVMMRNRERHRKTLQAASVEHGKSVRRIARKQKAVYVVTSAQNATPVNPEFLASLQQFCTHRAATLVVIPTRYKNPTSVFTSDQLDSDWWASEVAAYLVDESVSLNEHLQLVGEIKIQPTAVEPLTGLDSYTANKSAIFGHPKISLKTVATPQNRLPKMLTTTGAVTVPNFTDSAAGKKGEFHHTYGAVVVEIDGGRFHLRHVIATDDGSFIDLDMHYSPTGVSAAPRPLALVMGDVHAWCVDESVMLATRHRDNSMINKLRPHELITHDVLDFYTGSHHHANSLLMRLHKHGAQRNDILTELKITAGVLDQLTADGMKVVIVPSNHHDHLMRWLDTVDARHDPQNFEFYVRTWAAAYDHGGRHRLTSFDPFYYWLGRLLKNRQCFTLLRKDESHMVAGVECALHGDKGPNGARGSIKNLSRIGVKTIIGHSHSPGICEGAYQVGTSSVLNPEYVCGPSSWLHTHAILYANGKRALLHIIDGEYTTFFN